MVELHRMEESLGASSIDRVWVVKQLCNSKLGYYTSTLETIIRSCESGKDTLIGSHE
jgi:hypothetical protein